MPRRWRCESVGLLSHPGLSFTPVSLPIGQAGLGIVLVFGVKSLRFLISEVEMGFSALVSVSSIRWESARKQGADCSASRMCPMGQL